MNRRKRLFRLGWILPFVLLTGVVLVMVSSASGWGCKPTKYVVLAWNNLGMHCFSPDFSNLAILPPYNTLQAQVIKVGDPPTFVTEGVTIQYQFQGNTFSSGKTNFWKYATKLFNLSTPLPPNIGLAGKGLKGTLDPIPGTTRFEAKGIPLTQYFDIDRNLRSPYPYQLALVSVLNSSGNVVAKTEAVAPVSSELNCINCHSDTGDATTRYPIKPTGKVETNILSLHDYLNQGNPLAQPPLLSSQPVLCAKCHADNALGTEGVQGVGSLSFAMHNHHNNDCSTNPNCIPDIALNTTSGCYNCHPGPRTQCLRCTMSQHYALNCTTCHGNMVLPATPPGASGDYGVASSIAAGRDPWNQEPTCSTTGCHGAGYAPDQPLYQNSRGHGGTFCAGCHDSPHAIALSRQSNDAIKFIALQGYSGTLRKCTVCHATQPTQAFQHSWVH